MITMKVKKFTIHELKTMQEALNIAQAAVCPDNAECENCVNKRVCADLTEAAIFCKKAAEERELKYR